MNKLITIIFPLILSFIVTFLFSCNFNNEIPKPKFQPPSYVFSIVWSFIYLCFGYYLHITNGIKDTKLKNQILMVWFVNLLLNLYWSPLFTCEKQYKQAFFIMIALLFSNYVLYTLGPSKEAKLCMTPYIVWLHVALMLNADIINKT
jgi:tryptophan-rich sensory protein